MFLAYWIFVFVFLITGFMTGNDALFFVAIGWGVVAAIEELVTAVTLRFKKKNEFEEWTMKFNDNMQKKNDNEMKKMYERYEL